MRRILATSILSAALVGGALAAAPAANASVPHVSSSASLVVATPSAAPVTHFCPDGIVGVPPKAPKKTQGAKKGPKARGAMFPVYKLKPGKKPKSRGGHVAKKHEKLGGLSVTVRFN